eukprot:scaffold3267_cov140-Cylindrotheca_fusiformis.AAC.3
MKRKVAMDNLNRDRDSLAALESLLRIRSAGQLQVIEQDNNGARTQIPHVSSSSSQQQQQAGHQLLSQYGNNGAGYFSTYNAHVQLAAARAAIAAANNPGGSSNSASGLGVPNPLSNNNGFSIIPSDGNEHGNESAEAREIRKEKVEAALRSKPQRGRKRDDLSDKERQELTRSRNREHAKTTRIRKKARYEELLECERKLKDISEQNERNELRCKAIESFLALRQNMIRCCIQDDAMAEAAQEDGEGQPQEQEEPETPKSSNPAKTPINTRPVDHEAILGHLVVENMDQFQHTIKSPTGGAFDGKASYTGDKESCLQSMNLFDKMVADRVVQKYGIGAEQYLVYKIPEEESIALNKNGTTAFVPVELSMDLSESNKTTILSFLLTAKFETDSVRLVSMEWATVPDEQTTSSSSFLFSSSNDGNNNTTTATRSNSASPVSNMRRSQSIFPSVVSLEQSSKAVTRKLSSDNLGMNL